MNKPSIHELTHDVEFQDEIDLREYIFVLAKYKWAIIGFTLIVMVLTTFYVSTITPIYKATATLLIESEEANIVSIDQVYGLPRVNNTYFETQLQILQSRGLAEQIIDKLKLEDHPEFNPETKKKKFNLNPLSWIPKSWISNNSTSEVSQKPTEQNKRNRLVGQFSSHLKISPVQRSQLINISYDSAYPELTAEVANTLANTYISSGLQTRSEMTEQASGWIVERMEELKNNLEKSQKELQAYLDTEKLINVEGVGTIAAKEVAEITSGLIDARRNRSEAEELYRQITALKGQPIEAYESIPAVLKDSNVQTAKQSMAVAESKVSELKKRYGPKHPKMIAAIAELDTVKKNVEIQIRNVIDSVQKEYSVARAKESHLSSALSSTKSEISEINRKEHKFNALQQEVDSNKEVYELFLERFKETTATSDIQPQNARVIDKAVVPSSPYKPNKSTIILIAMLLAIVSSTVFGFLIEALDNTLKDSHDVENKLLFPVLSIVPKLNIWLNKDVKTLRYFTNHQQSAFSESFRTIRTSTLLTGIDDAQKVILITSSVPEEGKSAVSVNLAMALGQMGKTLLIDADMRKPSIAKVFAIDQKNPGLSQLIAGQAEFAQCVNHYENEKIDVLAAGTLPPNPLEMLSSIKFKNVLDEMKKKYQYIVIDSAPTVPVSDAVVMSKLVSSVIYVIRAEKTPYQLARNGIKKLLKVDANVIGLVLNMVNPSKNPGRYGYAESDYYSYYGYSNK